MYNKIFDLFTILILIYFIFLSINFKVLYFYLIKINFQFLLKNAKLYFNMAQQNKI